MKRESLIVGGAVVVAFVFLTPEGRSATSLDVKSIPQALGLTEESGFMQSFDPGEQPNRDPNDDPDEPNAGVAGVGTVDQDEAMLFTGAAEGPSTFEEQFDADGNLNRDPNDDPEEPNAGVSGVGSVDEDEAKLFSGAGGLTDTDDDGGGSGGGGGGSSYGRLM